MTSTPLPDLFSVLKDICFSWPCYFWSHNILPPNPVRSPEGLLFPFPFLIVASFSLTCFGQHFYSSVFQIWFPDPVWCINHTTFWQLIDLPSCVPTTQDIAISKSKSLPHPKLAPLLLFRDCSYHVLWSPSHLVNPYSVGYLLDTYTLNRKWWFSSFPFRCSTLSPYNILSI